MREPANVQRPGPEVPLHTTRQLVERLELVEELWLSVLHSECPPGQLERLIRLKDLCGRFDPQEDSGRNTPSGAGVNSEAIDRVIREMDLADGIAAARAFSLYFQLINILEQHIEENTYIESLRRAAAANQWDPFEPPLANQSEPETFRQLFERLRAL
ncbi:MAG: phosphoenolpyruvate carboxylase, partial [Cyanobium sp.]